MNHNELSSERTFQLWDYKISHGFLLVRSPKDATHSLNIDLVFMEVEYIHCPRFLKGIQVLPPSEQEVVGIGYDLGKSVEAKNVHILKCGHHRFIVVAHSLRILESDMDIFDSPIED